LGIDNNFAIDPHIFLLIIKHMYKSKNCQQRYKYFHLEPEELFPERDPE
jgi:hypothetical protein